MRMAAPRAGRGMCIPACKSSKPSFYTRSRRMSFPSTSFGTGCLRPAAFMPPRTPENGVTLATPRVSHWPKKCLDISMFDPTDAPRVFGVPLGVDFPKALVEGLLALQDGKPPEALARVHLIVNTRRMA